MSSIFKAGEAMLLGLAGVREPRNGAVMRRNPWTPLAVLAFAQFMVVLDAVNARSPRDFGDGGAAIELTVRSNIDEGHNPGSYN